MLWFGSSVLPIPDRDELALVLAVLDLDVGQGGEAARAPVDDALRAVDQTVVVQPLEDFADGARRPSSIVNRSRDQSHAVADPTHLVEDLPAVFVLPLPHPGDERVAAQVVARQPLAGQFPFDNVLRRDAGVIHAGLPQRLVSLHAPATDQRVDDRVLEGVAEVQAPGHIGRRDHDAVRRRCLGHRRGVDLEVAGLDPALVQRTLDLRRRVCVGRSRRVAQGRRGGHLLSLRSVTSPRSADVRRLARPAPWGDARRPAPVDTMPPPVHRLPRPRRAAAPAPRRPLRHDRSWRARPGSRLVRRLSHPRARSLIQLGSTRV